MKKLWIWENDIKFDRMLKKFFSDISSIDEITLLNICFPLISEEFGNILSLDEVDFQNTKTLIQNLSKLPAL